MLTTTDKIIKIFKKIDISDRKIDTITRPYIYSVEEVEKIKLSNNKMIIKANEELINDFFEIKEKNIMQKDYEKRLKEYM